MYISLRNRISTLHDHFDLVYPSTYLPFCPPPPPPLSHKPVRIGLEVMRVNIGWTARMKWADGLVASVDESRPELTDWSESFSRPVLPQVIQCQFSVSSFTLSVQCIAKSHYHQRPLTVTKSRYCFAQSSGPSHMLLLTICQCG